MANDQRKIALPTPTEQVGVKRGGPPHVVDGIGPGKGMLTPSNAQTITPQVQTSKLK